MAAPAAPVAPAIGLNLAVGLAVVAGLIVGVGLRYAWDNSLGYLIVTLGKSLKVNVWVIKIDFGKPFLKLEELVQDALGKWIIANERVVGAWLHANALAIEWAVDSIDAFGIAVHDAIDGIVHGTIPRVAGALVEPWSKTVGTVQRTVKVVRVETVRQVTRVVRAQAAEADQAFGRAWRGIDHIQRAELPSLRRALNGVRARLGHLEHTLGRTLPRRLTRLESWLAGGVLAAAGIAALTRVFPYYQCSNVKRFNRQLCRAPFGALDDLLALTLFSLTGFSLLEFARLMQGAVGPVTDAAHLFIDETRG